MDMKGLSLVEGNSLETITGVLDKNKIKYMHIWSPNQGGGYFRDSSIKIRIEDYSKFLSVISGPKFTNIRNVDHYHGYYEFNKEFDFTQLNGSIKFKEGKLVERISVHH